MIATQINGQMVGPRDFGRDAVGYVAWMLAMNAAATCSRREGVVELWRHEAKKVLTGEYRRDAAETVGDPTSGIPPARREATGTAQERVKAALDALQQAQNLADLAAREPCSVRGIGNTWGETCELGRTIKSHWHDVNNTAAGNAEKLGVDNP